MSPLTRRYGPSPGQEGDLHLPSRRRPAVIGLLHGGFWRMPYGRDQMDAVARDLSHRGFAAWNMEYRRIGAPSGGWPGTFDDVLAGVDHLARCVADGIDLDLDRVALCGHSAGGHLALWAAAQRRGGPRGGSGPGVRIRAVVAQAPVADLALAHEMGVGGSAVAELLGGGPAEQPGRCAAASPRALVPLGVPQLVIHGTADDAVPIAIARGYAQAALAAGDETDLLELTGAGHMDFLDPGSAAHLATCAWLEGGAGRLAAGLGIPEEHRPDHAPAFRLHGPDPHTPRGFNGLEGKP